MNWKTDLQLRDLGAAQQVEATCKVCGPVSIGIATSSTVPFSPFGNSARLQ